MLVVLFFLARRMLSLTSEHRAAGLTLLASARTAVAKVTRVRSSLKTKKKMAAVAFRGLLSCACGASSMAPNSVVRRSFASA